MHQLSIIRQSERVKGDWWMSSPISRAHPAYLTTTTPPSLVLQTACPLNKQHQTWSTGSAERRGQDGGDKSQLLMKRRDLIAPVFIVL